MAELKLKLIADLKGLKKQLDEVLEKKFKLDVGGKATGGGGGKAGGGSPVAGVLGKILKAVLPIGLLLSLKPIQQILELLLGFLTVLLLKILQELGIISGREDPFFPEIEEQLNDIANLNESIVQSLAHLSELERLKVLELVQKAIEDTGLSLEAAQFANMDFLRNTLQNIGIDITSKTDEEIREIVAAALTADQNIKDLEEVLDSDLVATKEELAKGLPLIKDRLGEVKDALDLGLDDTTQTLSKELKEIQDKEDSMLELQGNLGLLEGILNFIEKVFNVLDRLPIIGSFINRVGDAIIKPDGSIIKTDPRDTLIATQNPGNMGGNINVTFNGITIDEAFDHLKNLLGEDIVRSARF